MDTDERNARNKNTTMSAAFTVDVGRTGLLFSVEIAEETIEKVLVMRDGQPDVARYHDAMRATPTSSTTLMPMEMQKALQKKALGIWMKENPDAMRELDGKGCHALPHVQDDLPEGMLQGVRRPRMAVLPHRRGWHQPQAHRLRQAGEHRAG